MRPPLAALEDRVGAGFILCVIILYIYMSQSHSYILAKYVLTCWILLPCDCWFLLLFRDQEFSMEASSLPHIYTWYSVSAYWDCRSK